MSYKVLNSVPWCVLSSCERYPAYSVIDRTILDDSRPVSISAVVLRSPRIKFGSSSGWEWCKGSKLKMPRNTTNFVLQHWKQTMTAMRKKPKQRKNSSVANKETETEKNSVSNKEPALRCSPPNGVREGSIEELTTWCLEGRPALKWPPTAFSLNFMPLQQFVQKALL